MKKSAADNRYSASTFPAFMGLLGNLSDRVVPSDRSLFEIVSPQG